MRAPERDDRSLADVEVVDIEIDVGLLRTVGVRPNGWLVIRRQLERQGRTGITAQLHPIAVVTIHGHPVMSL